jgi:tRNA threonylcarbamoyladenosine biosynthesis protein TsaE
MKYNFETSDSKMTEEFARKIGKKLKGSEVIELVGDLGSGKTTFVKGLVKGAGSEDEVASPTFTINKIYEGKDVSIYHYDFYRLSDPGEMKHELEEAINDPNAVLVIEWSDIVKKLLPSNRLTITLGVLGMDERSIEVECPKVMEYLIN